MQKFNPDDTGINNACIFLFDEDNPDKIFNVVLNSYEESASIKLKIIKFATEQAELTLNKELCSMNRLVIGDVVMNFHNKRDYDYYIRRGKIGLGYEVRIHE